MTCSLLQCCSRQAFSKALLLRIADFCLPRQKVHVHKTVLIIHAATVKCSSNHRHSALSLLWPCPRLLVVIICTRATYQSSRIKLNFIDMQYFCSNGCITSRFPLHVITTEILAVSVLKVIAYYQPFPHSLMKDGTNSDTEQAQSYVFTHHCAGMWLWLI